MKKGEVVMVYVDPVTRQRQEGQATLLRCAARYGDLERWCVRFADGSVVERNLKVEGSEHENQEE